MPSSIGERSLLHRREPALCIDVLEIKLGDEFLMSSHFTASAVELGRLGVAECAGAECAGSGLDVVVGGLGLGYTAQAVLESTAVASLLGVDALEAVNDWPPSGLLPLAPDRNSAVEGTG